MNATAVGVPDAVTVRALIDERAAVSGEAIFLLDPEAAAGERATVDGPAPGTVTYASLRQRVRRVAARLAALGVQPGESVAYAMGNSSNCALCLLGIVYGGYRAVAVNLVAGTATIGYVLTHSETRLVLVDPAHRALIDDALADPGIDGARGADRNPPEILEVDASLTAASLEREGDASPEAIVADAPSPSGDSDALLMYTSGTTGHPKGVVLTHANLLAGGRNASLAHGLSATDRALCVLPLYHINGLCVTILAPLVSGGSVVLPIHFSASRFWAWAAERHCSWFSVVPTQIAYLLHGEATPDPSSRERLRFGRSASAPLSPDVHRAFEERFAVPLIETMGLTETAAQILSNPLPPGRRKIGSAGLAFGCEAVIADEGHRERPRGAEGELLIRGPNVMNRYLKNEAETAKALTAEGWLCTGDLGRMDEEGYVFVTGRLKELIIKGGENIAPREIDDALYRHADVIEAAAFACPCEDYGQRVEAAVRIDPASSVDEAELLTLCRQALGEFKTPDRIHFLDELPKGPSGKIQRIKVAARVSERRERC